MTNLSFEEEEQFDKAHALQLSYDRRVASLKAQNTFLFSLLKDAQTEIEWASSEMCGREPDHWKDVRSRLKIVIEDLEK